MSLLRCLIACALSLLTIQSSIAQDVKPYFMLSFDEKGTLEDAKAWKTQLAELKKRKPTDVFLVCHGWRQSKDRADETYTYFGKTLRDMQRKDEAIEVIGIRWPSLIGENDSAGDLAFKQVTRTITSAIPKARNVDEYREKLKTYLKKRTTRAIVRTVLRFELPEDERIDELLDNADDPENVEKMLTMLSYYEMKRRAGIVGSTGVQSALTELQEALPGTRVHLVGHSFGCKVWLSCLADKERENRQVDSLTLLQAAVSMHCFCPKVAELDDMPGAYADVPKRVKGSIAITHTKNDKALSIAYVGASQMAGHVAEVPTRKYKLNPNVYKALGSKGIGGIDGIPEAELCACDAPYKLRPGLNAFCGDKLIRDHGDIRRDEVAWLIWSAARHRIR